MKRLTVILGVVALVLLSGGIGFAIAYFLVPKSDSGQSSDGSGENEILYWVAPMDPNYRRDKPGKSPMGMDLVPVYADSASSEEDVVLVDPHVVQNLGVRTEQVKNGRLNRQVRTVGYIEYDENAMHHVHTRVDGWIEKLSVKAQGDPIEQGQILFEIYSPTLVNAQQEYLMAKSGSDQDITVASRERLESLGLTKEQIEELDDSQTASQRVRVYAKSDGVVGMLGVREGIFVTPSTHAMSIAELDRVWLVAEVLERQAGYVEVGQAVEFELDSAPGKTYKGEVDYVYPELDPISRSLKVRITFDRGKDVIRPNMFARVRILVEGSEPVLHVTSTAVIRGGLTDRVVLDLGDGRFRSTPVVIGMEADDRVEVVEGLKSGDKIVTSGQFMIDSESNIEAALARFEEAKKEAARPTKVSVNATVRGSTRDEKKIRVRHGRVPEWGWMAMTMNLEVADVVMLDDVEIGQEVILDIERLEEGGYVIVAIHPRDVPTKVSVDGIVRGRNREKSTVRVELDPVPEWSWDAKTRGLRVQKVEMLDDLQMGQEVTIDIEKLEGSNVIVEIRPKEEDATDSKDPADAGSP